jgi:G3E family GTPase
LKQIKTNIITGFLGVGKTTAILNLLANKPSNEVWAVLVNEFGEIGIDGALLKSQGAVVKEIPGGCMCCVAGLPMQVGLNILISNSKPDRLLIEPTGLGHPKQIINTLTNKYYGGLLDLKATITLVDPRNLSNQRYLNNENFRDQLSLADVVVANKTELCSDKDKRLFEAHMATYQPSKQVIGWVSQGEIDPHWLAYSRITRQEINSPHAHAHSNNNLPAATLELKNGDSFLRKENSGQGFFSCGWLFGKDTKFNYDALFNFFSGLDVDRLKAVVKTNRGVYSFNAVKGVLTVNSLPDAIDSRIELIDLKELVWDEIERTLLDSSTNMNTERDRCTPPHPL